MTIIGSMTNGLKLGLFPVLLLGAQVLATYYFSSKVRWAFNFYVGIQAYSIII
jgi:hypothetical protein